MAVDFSRMRRRLLAGSIGWPVLAGLPGLAGAVSSTMRGLTARHAFVGDLDETYLAIDADRPVQIASITKLITAWVVLSAELPLHETVRITAEDVRMSGGTASGLPVGSRWSRAVLLEWAVVASDNRAAAALARTFPGGWPEFQYAMRALMTQMQLLSFDFGDSSGLSPLNKASARDLGVLLLTLAGLPYFQQLTTRSSVGGKANVNRFAHDRSVAMLSGKTGFTSLAGYCLAQAEQIDGRTVALVVLHAANKESRAADMNRLRSFARTALQG